MPRPDLTSHLARAPLSVTAAADRLGISPSTLRTWERRYGLGPPHRQAGKRRRYGREELELLENMVRLVRSGVSPADAAASLRDTHSLLVEAGEEPSLDDLAREAQNGCAETLHRQLDILVAREGLLHTWTDYVAPLMERMRYPKEGDRPGILPRVVLTQVVLTVVGEVAGQCESHALEAPPGCPVLIVADDARELHAHIIGVALEWEGIHSRIVPVIVPASDPAVSTADLIELINRYRSGQGAHTVVLLGALVGEAELLAGLDNGDHHLVLVGPHRQVEAAPTATRVRTLSAAVGEVIELARNCPYDD